MWLWGILVHPLLNVFSSEAVQFDWVSSVLRKRPVDRDVSLNLQVAL